MFQGTVCGWLVPNRNIMAEGRGVAKLCSSWQLRAKQRTEPERKGPGIRQRSQGHISIIHPDTGKRVSHQSSEWTPKLALHPNHLIRCLIISAKGANSSREMKELENAIC